jgi:hypothetical protein
MLQYMNPLRDIRSGPLKTSSNKNQYTTLTAMLS